jgi:hypothetical protein
MFEQHPSIKPCSTMKTAVEAFKGDRHWREAEEDEQRMILDEWTTEQRRNAEVGIIVSTGFQRRGFADDRMPSGNYVIETFKL